MTERIEKTLAFLQSSFENTLYFQTDPAAKRYRLEHSIRVANLCGQIARAEGWDEELAVIAGLLHDAGYGQDFPADYNWNEHGRDGARFVRPFLESLGLGAETVNEICYAIAIHVDDKADFEGERTSFALTVGDADNIDRFDAYRVYEAVRHLLKPEEHTLEENLAWTRDRLDRLERLREMPFATVTAAALWQDKVDFQVQFFRRLLAQFEWSRIPEQQEETP